MQFKAQRGALTSLIFVSGDRRHFDDSSYSFLRSLREASIYRVVDMQEGFGLVGAEVPTKCQNCATLSELHFVSYQPSLYPIPFNRYPVTNLSVLSVQGPFSAESSGIPLALFDLITNNVALTSLSLDVAWTSGAQHFSRLADNLPSLFFSSLRHLRLPRWHVDISSAWIKMMPSLTSLDVTPPSPGTDHSTLWTVLREENVHLKDLSVTVVTQELISYLKSYSGLHSLVLTDVESDRFLSEQLYTQVIPKHAEMLVSLTVDGRNNDEWCLEAGHASVFRSCGKLKDLSVVIKAEALSDIKTLMSSIPLSLRTLCLTWNTSDPDVEYLRSFIFRLYDSDLESRPLNQSLIIYADIVYLLGRVDEGKSGFVFRGFKTHRSQLNWAAARSLCGSSKT
ncbi:hypothetical protein PQX77_020408 [Marasmius sp. AFHP31]|nr:hypothetical protein PQX77_020408 [Marasmius sp. AFHP31]